MGDDSRKCKESSIAVDSVMGEESLCVSVASNRCESANSADGENPG
jgi:hypothetical protein